MIFNVEIMKQALSSLVIKDGCKVTEKKINSIDDSAFRSVLFLIALQY